MYACIKGNSVVNVIIADEDFIKYIEADYDKVIPSFGGASIGWTWNEIDGFVAPPVETPIVDAVVVTP